MQVFQHPAMNTTFTLRFLSEDSQLCKSVARICIELIDDLESRLSRYREGSDVSQINHMRSGESLFIHETTYNCIRHALEMHSLTMGLFDITLGKQIEHVKHNRLGKIPSLLGTLALDPNRPVVHCVAEGREIDLGGIGKGFALDLAKETAAQHGIASGLISAGASTHIAFGESTWPIQLEDLLENKIHLVNQALSVSGIEIQGHHIIRPDSLDAITQHARVCVIADSATIADSLSTAIMISEPNQIEQIQVNTGASTKIIMPDKE